MKRSWVLVVMVVALALFGCSDDEGSLEASGSATTAPDESSDSEDTAGSDEPDAVPLDEWIEQADGICGDYEEQFDALGEPASLDEIAEMSEGASELLESQLEELTELGVPDEMAEEVEQAVALLEDQRTLLGDLAEAASDGDEATVEEIADGGQQLDDQLDELAAEIGLEVCGGSAEGDEDTGDSADPADGSGSGDEAFTYGDDPALDALWDECEAGELEACDELFWSSPGGSEYESYGNTCGGRFSEEDVPLSCADDSTGDDAADADPSDVGGDSGDEPYTYGDDEVLDALWDECEAGDATSCDQLFFDSPPASDYETFGATCGRRFDPIDAPVSCEGEI